MSHKNPLAVIYITGLGDHRVRGQRLAVTAWRWQGVQPYLFQMKWADGETFALKLKRLLTLIDQLAGEGKRVTLVGASAGGSVVIHALAARPQTLSGAVLLCGKIRNAGSISDATYRQNSAFQQSMSRLPTATAALTSEVRSRILSLHALLDFIVPPPDTRLNGATHGILPICGHTTGIALGITLYSPRVLFFLKRQHRLHQLSTS